MALTEIAPTGEPSAASNLGALGDLRIQSGLHQLCFEMLGRPAWQTAGTTLAGKEGPIPGIISVADDLMMMENIVGQIGAAGFVDLLVKDRVRLSGRAGLLAMHYAPSLREGLDYVVGYVGQSHPYLIIEQVAEPGRVLYRVRPAVPLGSAWPAMATIYPLFLLQLIESLAFHDVDRLRVDIDPMLGTNTELYERWFRCKVQYVEQASGVAIPDDVANRPNTLADAGLWAFACHQLDADAKSLDPSPEATGARAIVRKVLDTQCRVPFIKEVASSLRLSERTLIRRLAEASTSFRALADDERKRKALLLIIDPAFDIQTVSDKLGFPDRSIFGRKFRSWTGETPAGYRTRRISHRRPPFQPQQATSLRSSH